jgi:hypothetical protein
MTTESATASLGPALGGKRRGLLIAPAIRAFT